MRTLIASTLVLLSLIGCGDSEGPRSIPDDFCHGQPDGTRCDDGSACTIDDLCGLGVCAGRPALDCSGLDEGCVVGVCDPDTVTCVTIPVSDGTSCDDGAACTVDDVCTAGLCGGAPRVCDAGPCADAVCSPEDGACVVTPRQEGAACDDGDLCTTGGICTSGECVETAVECEGSACEDAACDPETGACVVTPRAEGAECEDGNPCTTGETCVAGNCGGATQLPDGSACEFADQCILPGQCRSGVCDAEARPCPEPGPCQVQTCDPQTGACGLEAAVDGTSCDDRDACTLGETCQAGVCGGGSNQCFCSDKEDGTPCNDGQRCTANDMCEDGACLGVPLDCSSLNDGSCIVGSCQPETGECVRLPVADGTGCNDGKACTSLDRCTNGSCTGITPDCTGLDDACNVGACQEGAGGCVAVPRADGLSCSDNDVCTGGDRCAAGTCTGGLDACGACQGKAVGDGCDDADACTDASVCVAVGGQLRCEGVPRDCSNLDGPCVIGICGGDGACTTVPRPDGVSCDDTDACTLADVCTDGRCGGDAIMTCGAVVEACEPPVANEDPDQATLFPTLIIGQPVTALGRIDPTSETDWWVLAVGGGHLVTIETKAHCSSALDAVLGVYLEDGTLLGEDDDSGANEWAKASDVLVPEGVTHVLVGVSAYSGSGAASYLLQVTEELVPPCATDADCSCGELSCVRVGPNAGKCLPKMPAEVQPNQAPELASPIPEGGEVRGELASVDEADWFLVSLPANTPVSFTTRNYCGAELMTELAVFDLDGVTELGAAIAGGPEGHARMTRFEVREAGDYLVRVRSQGATLGAYVLSMALETCVSDAECGCGDETCSGDATTPGMCVPRLDAPSASVVPKGIELGQRVHGEVGVAYEVDRFTLPVGAGTYDIETGTYCGTGSDTHLSIYDGQGRLLAEDDDSGDGYFAAVFGLEVPVVTTLEIRVRTHGPSVGEYILSARPARNP